jgi:hypothetical protein
MRQGNGRQGKGRNVKGRQGKGRQGKPGKAWGGKARDGKARGNKARSGKASGRPVSARGHRGYENPRQVVQLVILKRAMLNPLKMSTFTSIMRSKPQTTRGSREVLKIFIMKRTMLIS